MSGGDWHTSRWYDWIDVLIPIMLLLIGIRLGAKQALWSPRWRFLATSDWPWRLLAGLIFALYIGYDLTTCGAAGAS